MCTYYVHRHFNCSQEHSALSQAIATITGSMATEREGPEGYIMDTATLDECRIYGANMSET